MGRADELRAKWARRHRDREGPAQPAGVLLENAHLLPPRGDALDLACGLGGNALFLAARGLRVRAWDLSPVAIERLADEARARAVVVTAEVRDVVARPPEPDGFDVIVVSHFLDRGLAPALARGLRPGGLLYYQTFVREAVTDRGPPNLEYRLERNELLRLFPGLVLRVYREEGRLGDTARGTRDLAWLVAERPAAGSA
jgi:SAM-dependent methyltransferase